MAPKLLGVTVLTSLGADELRDELGLVRPPQEQVVFWAEQARDCGFRGWWPLPRRSARSASTVEAVF